MAKHVIHTGYLPELDTDLAALRVNKAAIKLKSLEFEAVAFRGMSGAIMAPMIALTLKKPLILVRKNVTDCHSGSMVEGAYEAPTYLIIDDLISSGKTVLTIDEEIKKRNPKIQCVGIYVYQNDYLYTEKNASGDLGKIFNKKPENSPPPAVRCDYTGTPIPEPKKEIAPPPAKDYGNPYRYYDPYNYNR